MTWKFHIFAIDNGGSSPGFCKSSRAKWSVFTPLPEQSAAKKYASLFSCEQDKAYRIEALLHRLEGVLKISIVLQPTTPLV
jgi:hypothetical protein